MVVPDFYLTHLSPKFDNVVFHHYFQRANQRLGVVVIKFPLIITQVLTYDSERDIGVYVSKHRYCVGIDSFPPGGSLLKFLRTFLNAQDSLIYIHIAYATGWSIVSTPLPMRLVILAQSEHMGLVGLDFPCLASCGHCELNKSSRVDWLC